MNYRSFKGTPVSEVGLGTWQLGGEEWGSVDKESAFSILQTFVDNGGNFIDTSDIYGVGVSEKIIGEFLENLKNDHKIYIATKLGKRKDNGYGFPQNFTYDVMRQHIVSSLKNLDISQIFLEQLHCIPKEQLEKGNVFNHLRKFQDEGLIKHWGASVQTANEALICLEQEGLGSLQIIFNLFRQHVADELFQKAKEKDVSIIVRVPLASGLLTGKFDENTTFAENDHRNFNADGSEFNVGETFSGIKFEKGVKLARKIEKLLPGDNLPQLALRWILDHPQVTTVIPGASKASQVKANTKASSLNPLSKSTHQKLRQLYDDEILQSIRGRY